MNPNDNKVLPAICRVERALSNGTFIVKDRVSCVIKRFEVVFQIGLGGIK